MKKRAKIPELAAMQTKPKGPSTQTCRLCKGDGCASCGGWGWKPTPGACLVPATGRVSTCGRCLDSPPGGCRA